MAEPANHERSQAVSGVFWLALERVIGFSVSFGGGILLARLLTPADFGMVALASSFFLIAGRISGVGVNVEIIRADENRPDYLRTLHTWFWLNAALTLLVCAGVCAFALLSGFFGDTGALVACAVAGGWTINNLFDPCRCLLQRQLRFKALSFLQWLPGALGMLGGVGMALAGCGVWSLVLPQMACLALAGLWAFTLCGYRPAWTFHWPDAAALLRRAPYYVGSSLCEGAYQKVDTLAVGKVLGAGMLGLYDRAYMIGGLFHQNIGVILTRIALPLFSRRAQQPEEIARLYSLVIRAILYISFFAIAFFSLYAPQIITFLWGEKWLTAAQIFRVMAPYSILLPAFYITKDVLFALGEVKQATRAYVWVLATICVLVYPFMQLGEAGTDWWNAYAAGRGAGAMTVTGGGLYGAAGAVDVALAIGVWQMARRLKSRVPGLRILRSVIVPLLWSAAAFVLLLILLYAVSPFVLGASQVSLLLLHEPDAPETLVQMYPGGPQIVRNVLLVVLMAGVWCGMFCGIMLTLEREVLAFALRIGTDLPMVNRFCRTFLRWFGLGC